LDGEEVKGKILVTDTLFIFDDHVRQIEEAGYEVVRLAKSDATESELIEAVKGKVGYILGGIEKITARVIEAADLLKVIAFTGTDWQYFIPGWEKAKERGIKIAQAPGANASAVAEFSLAMALLMQRNLLELGGPGDKTFETSGSLYQTEVGVIGAGHIGSRIIRMVHSFEPTKIRYTSRSRHPEVETEGAEYADLDTLLRACEVIFIAVPAAAGQILNQSAIEKLANNALLVNIAPSSLIDIDELFLRLKNGSLRAAIDYPAPRAEFTKLPLHTWYNTNDHAAYNTHSANKLGSDMGTSSLLNLLENGEDKHRVV
jgi:phosphoglycerate dehydrogenase-like enzyme